MTDSGVFIVVTALLSAIGSSGLISLIVYLIQRHDNKKNVISSNDSLQTKMILGLGHDKILYLTDKYVRRGSITLKEKRNLKFLYEPYSALGGNGDCEIGYNACQALDVVSEEEAIDIDAEMKRKEYRL